MMDKPKVKILILIDNFLIGGRETFIKSYLSALKDKQSYSFGLIANRINKDVSGNCFDYDHEMDKELPILNDWLFHGRVSINEFEPDIIWVHHYQLLPAWLLSCYSKIPLMSTLHGSIMDQGKYKKIEDQLGLACVLKNSSSVSVVSSEIKHQLMKFDCVNNPCLLVNAVQVTGGNQTELNTKTLQKKNGYEFVFLTRQQKLGHIRAGIKLFCKLKKIFPDSNLTIHTGKSTSEAKDTNKQLLSIVGRKWAIKHPTFLLNIKSIEFKPLAYDVTDVFTKADVVLGMGRVMIEAIARKKTALLVGYDHHVDVIGDDNFISLQHNNFSGRGSVPQTVQSIAKKIDHFIDKQNSLELVFEEIDVECQVRILESEIKDVLINQTVPNIAVDTKVEHEIKVLFDKVKHLKNISIDNELIELKASLATLVSQIQQ